MAFFNKEVMHGLGTPYWRTLTHLLTIYPKRVFTSGLWKQNGDNKGLNQLQLQNCFFLKRKITLLESP
jgi:hypothetical protein